MAETKKKKKSLKRNFNISIGRISLAQKVIFAKNLSLMLRAGLVLSEAVEIAHEQAVGKLRRVLKGVLLSIRSGQTLSDSFDRYPKVFSGLFVNVTQAGEMSGTLEENLKNIATELEKEKNLISKIKGAMLYPAVVLLAAFVMGLAVSFLILPKITPLFEGMRVELPLATRILIAFSHLMKDYGVVIFALLVAFVVALVFLITRNFTKPFTHWLLLHMPVIKGIVKNANLARFCYTLGTLLKSGVNIDRAIEVTRKTLGNHYYRRSIEKVSIRIAQGGKLGENLEDYGHLFPRILTRMITIGEKTGSLEDTLFYLADSYESEVDNATKSLSTLVEPILLIVIGSAVAFLALSIITPIYKITGSIKK